MSKPLTRCKSTRPPSNIVVLRCWGQSEKVSDTLTRHWLDRWNICHIRVRHCEKQSAVPYFGHLKDQLIACLRRCAKAHESIVLIGHDLRTDLQLGGIFECIDTGEIRVNWIELTPRLIGQLSIDDITIKLMDIKTWCDCELATAANWYDIKAHYDTRQYYHYQDEWMVLYMLVCDWLEFGATYAQSHIYPTTGRTAFEIWRNLYAPQDNITIPVWGDKKFLIPVMGDELGKNVIDSKALVQPQVYLPQSGHFKGPIYDLDIKSFYPALYLNKLQPSKLYASYENPKPSLVKELTSRHWCIARVKLSPSKHRVPTIYNETVIWQYPPCTTILAGDELEWYRASGTIINVLWIHAFNVADYLSNFGEAFIRFRDSAERDKKWAIAAYLKRVANSLWGRLAPKRNRWDKVENAPCVIPWGEWFCKVDGEEGIVKRRAIGDTVQQYRELGWSTKSWPAAAAFICAEARFYLNQIVDDAGEANILYRVVDGLHVNVQGFERLSNRCKWSDVEPGRLRVTGIYPSVTYYGRYTWEHTSGHRIAGLPSNGIQIEPGRYKATIYTGPAESYGLGDISSVYSRERIFDYSHNTLDKAPNNDIVNVDDW